MLVMQYSNCPKASATGLNLAAAALAAEQGSQAVSSGTKSMLGTFSPYIMICTAKCRLWDNLLIASV